MSRLMELVKRRPMLVAWVLLSIAMVTLLLWSSSDIGLLPSQLLAMIVATIALAGACVGIVSWE